MENNNIPISPIAVAPMMNWTDRHERYFLRQISRNVKLYSEMITCGAILRGNKDRLLSFSPGENPLALQIGGIDKSELSECARIGEDYGYDEINLNVGCPSDRVQSGNFGACLMATPDLVANAVNAMASAVNIPVTVKHRIAINDQEEWDSLFRFVEVVSTAGCRHFIVHARKALLDGLSAKENREVPPLRYELVYRLKEEFPNLSVTINGGITNLDSAEEHLCYVDGVMLGRAVYSEPYLLSEVDNRFFGEDRKNISRHEILESFLPYVEKSVGEGVPLKSIGRHLFGLFNGQPGARSWRRLLSEQLPKFNENPTEALKLLRSAANMVHCSNKFDVAA